MINPTAKTNVWELKSVTKHASTGKPMHSERGFIRALPDETIELVASHPFGLNEISCGSMLSGSRCELISTSDTLHRTPSASAPYTTGLMRVYDISSDAQYLTFTMDMATSTHPQLQNHLICKLERR